MVPRVACRSSAFCHSPCRRLAPCKFATGADVGHFFQQEIMIEGVLHVSAAQAGSCMERFGDIEAVPPPSLLPLDAVLTSGSSAGSDNSRSSTAQPSPATHAAPPARAAAAATLSRASSGSERVVNEAFCLATPPDNPTEGNRSPVRPINPSATGSPARDTPVLRGSAMREQAPNTNRLLTREAEQELLQFEAAAYQRAALSTQALYTHEVLRAADARRRQRRAALLRLVRSGRTLTNNSLSALQATPPAQLLASISSSISSVASWDDAPDDDICDLDAASGAYDRHPRHQVAHVPGSMPAGEGGSSENKTIDSGSAKCTMSSRVVNRSDNSPGHNHEE